MNKIENAVIKYQIDFEKYKNGCANEVISLLDKTNKEIAKYIKLTKDISTKKRYTEIARKLKDIAKTLRDGVDKSTDIDALIGYELDKQKSILKSVSKEIVKAKDVKVNFLYPSIEQIKTSALFKPIDIKTGMTYESFLNGIESGLYNIWDSSLRTGYLTGMSTDKIVENVLGGVSAKDKLVKQGAINSLRNSLWSNTRTVLQSFASETRNRIYEENEQYFGDAETDFKYEYIATLDTRSCLVCGSDDGKLFKSIKGCPQIPRHRGCRCVVIPYFGSIDGESRASKKGYIEDKVTFDKWLESQDEKTQKEVLGKTRYQLYKNGEKIKDFVDNGKVLTIKELNESILNIHDEKAKIDIENRLEELKIKPLELVKLKKPFSEDNIIRRISGGDKTKGSCVSLAFAYAADKAGYDVLDFRGGQSCDFFASMFNLKKIAGLQDVSSKIIEDFNDFKIAETLLKTAEVGKEYNLIVGRHSSIIRKLNTGKYEYLELQSKYSNGFFELNTQKLKKRFGCQKSHTSHGEKFKVRGILIDIETLAKNSNFLSMMRYINTNAGNQMKGAGGDVK